MSETTEEQKINVIDKIKSTNLPNLLKHEFYYFCLSFPMSNKNIITFLNMKSKAATIGYLYKHLIRTAIKQHVPRVYISEYFNAKKLVKNRWYIQERRHNIIILEDVSLRLLKATTQMGEYHNSRKNKIEKLKFEIEKNKLNSEAN